MFHLEGFTGYGLLLLRIMVGVIYAGSGYNDLKNPDQRAKNVGLPKSLTIFIAVAEIAGAAGIILGILQQLAAIGLIVIMGGAIHRKMFVWKTGFWGKDGLGWYYDLTLVSALLVIVFTDGGSLVVMR